MPIDEYNFLKKLKNKSSSSQTTNSNNIKTNIPCTLPISIEFIINSMPSEISKIAQTVMSKLNQSSDFEWNTKGEIIYKKQTIRQSNIIKLLIATIMKPKNINEIGYAVSKNFKQKRCIPRKYSHKQRKLSLFPNWCTYE